MLKRGLDYLKLQKPVIFLNKRLVLFLSGRTGEGGASQRAKRGQIADLCLELAADIDADRSLELRREGDLNCSRFPEFHGEGEFT